MSPTAQTANAQVKVPLAADIKQYFYDNAVVGETQRFRQINRYEAFYNCIAAGTDILMADGSLKLIEDVRPGDEVATLRDGKVGTYRVSAATPMGRQAVGKLLLRSGRSIRMTPDHRVLTEEGWSEVGGLTKGCRVVCPRTASAGNSFLSDAEASILGYMVGDGSVASGRFHFTQEPDSGVIEALRNDVATLGWGIHFIREYQYCVGFKKGPAQNWPDRESRRGPVHLFIEKHGLLGKRSHEKRIPEAVFKADRAAAARFLAALWDCDGHVHAEQPLSTLVTTSKKLAEDLLRLGLRIGIYFRMNQAKGWTLQDMPSGRSYFCKPAWQVTVAGLQMKQFARVIPLRHKEKASRAFAWASAVSAINFPGMDTVPPEIWEPHVQKSIRWHREHGTPFTPHRPLGRDLLLRMASEEGSEKLRQIATDDVYWDTVCSFIPDGEVEVYDLTVPDAETFVASGILVHNCLQYAHQPYDWWGLPADAAETVSPNVQVPIGWNQPALNLLARQKRPTSPYHLAKAIVDRFTGLLFSDARKPDVEVEGDPDTDDFLHACMEQMRFWARWREARAIGGACGSVMVTLHLKRGRFVIQAHNPKHVQILWKDRRALEPLAALIIYRYPQEEFTTDPKTGEMTTRIVEYLYRRIITDQDDTVYKPVKIEPAANLAWQVESTAEHGLGVFPGVWIQNKPVIEQEDGDPDCQGAWQSFDTIDRLLSQMNKALLLNLDPTLVLKIDPKELLAMGGSVRKGSDNALYVGSQGDAKYLEMIASGVEAGHKLVDRLKQNILDVTRCVLADPEKLSGAAQSAKAMEYIYAPMLEQADEFRSQWGDCGVIPILKLAEMMARKFHGVEVQQGDKTVVLELDLPKKSDGTPRVLGPGGWIRLKWGAYFAPTEMDKSTQVTTLIAAKTGELIDGETASSQAAPIFGVQDAKAMAAKIQLQRDKEAEDFNIDETPPPPPNEDKNEPPNPPAGQGGKP